MTNDTRILEGCPAAIVYDRTKTVIRRHVAPGVAVPLHPEAAAFADHYGFAIDVLAAYRPTGKGRVERQVNIVRDHVLAGRSFDSIAELDGAFASWLPIRRGQVHRTHGQVIAVRAEADRAALRPLPEQPYLVAERHLRRVGKDCLVCFEASCYSVPARLVRPGQRVELQIQRRPGRRTRSASTPWPPTAAAGSPAIPARDPPRRLGRRPGALGRAARRPHPRHHRRAVEARTGATAGPLEPLSALLTRRHADLTSPPDRWPTTPTPPTEGEPVSTLIADRIRDHATRLGLTHLTDTITELVDRAEAAQMGYLDFVDLLLEEEVGLREGRRFRNALKLSGLPHHKTLDEFDFAFQPDLDARKIRDLATLEFVEPSPTSPCSARPASARPCSPSPSPSPPARPASRSTSPPSTTWSAGSAPPRPPAGSTGNSRPSSDPPFSWSTYADTATMPRRRAAGPAALEWVRVVPACRHSRPASGQVQMEAQSRDDASGTVGLWRSRPGWTGGV